MSENSKKEKASDLTKLQEQLSNFFEDLMYDWGGSPLLGRIYALLLLSSDIPLLQKDLTEEFNVNPSTVSRNLKDLERWNLIQKRREPGSREWKYQVNDTSFLELLTYQQEELLNKLEERKGDLIRIRNHWGENLKGEHALYTLDRLIKWLEIVLSELNAFIQNLDKRFLEFEESA